MTLLGASIIYVHITFFPKLSYSRHHSKELRSLHNDPETDGEIWKYKMLDQHKLFKAWKTKAFKTHYNTWKLRLLTPNITIHTWVETKAFDTQHYNTYLCGYCIVSHQLVPDDITIGFRHFIVHALVPNSFWDGWSHPKPSKYIGCDCSSIDWLAFFFTVV